ncbi:MAG: hypothetical protein A3B23_03855 [Candidatus Colwellbacteria bacterium RIFCSPLOWO2_01_FULL_48_10]|uniref:Uncharacterized protein n=1 Tax=Candidatus Colwellbacteria bacterium RIFCSPLOWO2_01_FULL_48_10 TaxID=1797690 RepID=A0A1G1Z468_9BACT|nr:MAG: hypothetical protein A3B23_03855 [Candidatus Colwellbacteria bacterium RIFCSPLOWO2_01_FULL_48_10]
MTKLIKGFLAAFTKKGEKKSSDFSDFFTKSSGDKAKVIRQVLREANAEQKKMIETYREKLEIAPQP